jgi:hypothetical protein
MGLRSTAWIMHYEKYKFSLLNILMLENMGHVKELKGVDFVIESKPWTNKERQEVSKFIASYKARSDRKKLSKNGLK